MLVGLWEDMDKSMSGESSCQSKPTPSKPKICSQSLHYTAFISAHI